MNHLKFIVENTQTGYSAYCKEFPVYTTGKSKEDLLKNIMQATTVYFEYMELPMPKNITITFP